VKLANSHVHSHSHGAQIANTHNTTYHISAQIVKHQNFPDWISICVEDWRNRREQSIGNGFLSLARLDSLVEIENLLEGRYLVVSVHSFTNSVSKYLFGDPSASSLSSPWRSMAIACQHATKSDRCECAEAEEKVLLWSNQR
jgi:hypothetical protein